jgi:hypothetical protein
MADYRSGIRLVPARTALYARSWPEVAGETRQHQNFKLIGWDGFLTAFCSKANVNFAADAHGRFWPKADIPARPLFCRYRGKSRHPSKAPSASSIYESPRPGQEPQARRGERQRLGPKAGRQQRGEMKTRCPGKTRSTPLPDIPQRFEVKVTAKGPPALTFRAAAPAVWRSSRPCDGPCPAASKLF